MSFLPRATPKGRKSRQRAIARAANLLPDHDTMVDNILTVYNDERNTNNHARYWYSDFNHTLHSLANYHGITKSQAVGIFAALSPSTDVQRNLSLARTLVQTGDASHAYGDAIKKAQRILNGEHPTSVLGGRKVRSFYRNLMYPNRPGPVTVDRHAISIVYNRPLSDKEAKVLQRPGAYQLVALAYRAAARTQGTNPDGTPVILPHQMQAATWSTWRNHYAYGTTTNI